MERWLEACSGALRRLARGSTAITREAIDGSGKAEGNAVMVEGLEKCKGNAALVEGLEMMEDVIEGSEKAEGNAGVERSEKVKGSAFVEGSEKVKGNAAVEGHKRRGGMKNPEGKEVAGIMGGHGKKDLDRNERINGNQSLDRNRGLDPNEIFDEKKDLDRNEGLDGKKGLDRNEGGNAKHSEGKDAGQIAVPKLNDAQLPSPTDLESAYVLKDENLESLMDVTWNTVFIAAQSLDAPVMRSATLLWFHANRARKHPVKLRDTLNTLKTSKSRIATAALLWGAMTGDGEESVDVLNEMFELLDGCFSSEIKNAATDEPEEDDEELMTRILISCEALCAWGNRVAHVVTMPDKCVDEQYVTKAMNVSMFFLDHSKSNVVGVTRTAFERLATVSMVLDGGRTLSELFMAQVALLKSRDFASGSRRASYMLLGMLLKILGVVRIMELEPNMLSIVLKSAFRQDDATSHVSDLGNSLCTLFVGIIQDWLMATNQTVTNEMKTHMRSVAVELLRGPFDRFASYYVSRRLLIDLFGEQLGANKFAKDARTGETRTGLQDLGRSLLDGLIKEEEEMLRERKNQLEQDPSDAVRLLKNKALWARMSILTALERGGTHVGLVISLEEEKRMNRKRRFVLYKDTLITGLIHEWDEVRELSWTLATFRLKKAHFPEFLCLQAVESSFAFMLRKQHVAFATGIKTSVVRLLDRVHACLTSNTIEASETALGDEVSHRRAGLRQFVRSLTHMCAERLYPDASMYTFALALETAREILQIFRKTNKDSFFDMLEPLLTQGSVRSVFGLMTSRYDALRTVAFDYLHAIPGPLPGFETEHEVKMLLIQAQAMMDMPARRDADSGALVVRLVFKKYVTELGWRLDIVPRIMCSSSVRKEMDGNEQSLWDVHYMRLACEQARRCLSVDTAYDVGCVIVSKDGTKVLSTGFSREVDGNTHAEECALEKYLVLCQINENDEYIGATLYTTMEPCSLRLSGKKACADRILELPRGFINRVVVGVKEPDKFVKNCEGWIKLEAGGVRVCGLKNADALEIECMEISTGKRPAQQVGAARAAVAATAQPSKVSHPVDVLEVHFAEQLYNLTQARLEMCLNLEQGDRSECVDDNAIISRAFPYGWIIASKYVWNDASTLQSSPSRWTLFAEQVIESLLHSLNTAVNLLAKQETSEFANEQNDDDDTDTAWLSIREGSEFLGDLVQRLIKVKLISETDTKKAIHWFLAAPLAVRHLGAVTNLSKGLERACTSSLKSGNAELESIPGRIWIPDLFLKLASREFDKTLRRSEGFTCLFRAIVRSGVTCNRLDLVQDVMRLSLEASCDETEECKRVRGMNLLRGLFEDKVLNSTIMSFVSPGFETAMRGFRSNSWSTRNASLNLFASLVKRSVGDPDPPFEDEDVIGRKGSTLSSNKFDSDTISGSTMSSSHPRTTARMFFKTYPRLYLLFYDELVEAAAAEDLQHPSLHPVLVFLSSLRRSDAVGTDGESDPALSFVPLLERVVSTSSNYIIRMTAARALGVLTPKSKSSTEWLLSELENANSANAAHAAALRLHYVENRDDLVQRVEYVNRMIAYFKRHTEPPMVREVVLRTLSLLPGLNINSTNSLLEACDAVLSEPELKERPGTSRLMLRSSKTLTRLAVMKGDWDRTLRALQHPTSGEVRVGAFQEFCSIALSDRQDANNVFPEAEIMQVLLGSYSDPYEFECTSEEDAVRLEVAALICERRVSLGDFLSEIGQPCVAALLRAYRGTRSVRCRAAICCLLCSIAPSADVIVNSPPQQLRQEEEGAPIVMSRMDVLVENAREESPLELRMSAARSLINLGLFSGSGPDDDLHCCLLALTMLRDDDREVCELARIASKSVFVHDEESDSLIVSNNNNKCLNFVFHSAWGEMTDRFWDELKWRDALLTFAFAYELFDSNLPNRFMSTSESGGTEPAVEMESGGGRVTAAAAAPSSHAIVLKSRSGVYKEDDMNENYEVLEFAKYACDELIRVRRLLIENDQIDYAEWRGHSTRSSFMLNQVASLKPEEVFRDKYAFTAYTCALYAVRAVGDPTNANIVNAMARVGRNVDRMPWVTQIAYKDARKAMWG